MAGQRAFRFGVVGTPPNDGEQWRGMARRVEDMGYASLLMPDGLQLLSPLPSLAIAAGATSRLRVGTFVMAAPLRPPGLAAWDAHTLSLLLDGRFELGIGTGRPEVAEQAAKQLDQPELSVGQRLTRVEQTIDRLRELDGERHTPVLVAAGGPKARAVAAAKADIIALATGPLGSRDDVRRMSADIQAAAGARAGELELSMNIFIVGEEVPPWMQGFLGTDAATLKAHDSLTMLRGSTTEMADELRRRRDDFGASYITVNAAFFQQLAPVVELLTGR